MAQRRSTTIISMIKWIRTSKMSIKNCLSESSNLDDAPVVAADGAHVALAPDPTPRTHARTPGAGFRVNPTPSFAFVVGRFVLVVSCACVPRRIYQNSDPPPPRAQARTPGRGFGDWGLGLEVHGVLFYVYVAWVRGFGDRHPPCARARAPAYKGTSPIRKRPPLGPYRRPMPRVLRGF